MDNGNFGNGFLKKRNSIEAAIIILVMFIIFKYALFMVPFFLKTILFVTFAVFPAIIALLGIGDESLGEAIMTMRQYSKFKDIIPYSLAAYGVVEEEPGEKLTRKEKKERKKAKAKQKRDAKIAMKAKKKTDKIRSKAEKKIAKANKSADKAAGKIKEKPAKKKKKKKKKKKEE